jgi:hypothetical protein
MADIITSSNNAKQASLMKEFKQLVKKLNSTFSENVLSPLTITLGDEFQGVIKDISSAVTLIIFAEEQIIKRTPCWADRHYD